jgi:prepilin-type N-terminal cleavage/methylation domain-containing protein
MVFGATELVTGRFPVISMISTTSNYAQRERGRRLDQSAQRGISLVELVIAITVLAIGMAGLAVLFSTAIMNNSRSKGDTSGTMLTQTVLEQIAAQPANLAANLTLSDCNPAGAVAWPIATAGAASPGAGANINVATGAVDFTQAYAAVPANYKMQFVACGNNGRQTTYEVRWNIQTVTANTRLVTVSARPLAAASAGNRNQALLFAPPITLRTIGGL